MHRPLGAIAFVLCLCLRSLAAQCQPAWLPGEPLVHPVGQVAATTTWDPDGGGPLPSELVVAGVFDVERLVGARLASWDGATWTDRTPPPGEVTAVAVWNGQLVAATVGAVHVRSGSAWTTVGTLGLGVSPGRVTGMAVHGSALVVVGQFDAVDPFTPASVPVDRIAQWNGSAWSAIGPSFGGDPTCVVSFLGQLYVGCDIGFTPAPYQSLRVWNGTSWSSLGAWNGPVLALAQRTGTTVAASSLFVGGSYSQVDGQALRRVVRWSPSTAAWSALGTLPNTVGGCTHLVVRSTSLTAFEVAAAFDALPSEEHVWRSNGTAWTPLGLVDPGAFLTPVGLVHHGGRYRLAVGSGVGPQVDFLRQHDAATNSWSPVLAAGIDGHVAAACTLGADVVLGGQFATISGVAVNRVARGQPGAWQPLGSGVGGGSSPAVHAVVALPNGDLVVGGEFTTAGGAPASNVARWNGTNWAPLGAGVSARVNALLALPDGSVVAGGTFATAGGVVANGIARWNGNAWSAFGSGLESDVRALAWLPNGELVAAGRFATAGGVPAANIARWNGGSWSSLGSGIAGDVEALAVAPDGALWAGGDFLAAGGVQARNVARWNGTTWAASGAASFLQPDDVIQALTVLPNGDVIAGGLAFQIGGGTPTGAARLRGGVWSSLAVDGVDVRAVAQTSSGRVLLGGDFHVVGGAVSARFATLVPTCPATATTFGSGCAGAGGPDVLAATSLPWLGSVARARATGLPGSAIAVTIHGFQTLSLPLAGLLAQGGAGCTLLVSPDLLGAQLPVGGAVDTAVAVPATMALVGLVFHHQVAAFELGPAGQIQLVTTGNALTFTLGAL